MAIKAIEEYRVALKGMPASFNYQSKTIGTWRTLDNSLKDKVNTIPPRLIEASLQHLVLAQTRQTTQHDNNGDRIQSPENLHYLSEKGVLR